MKKYIKYCYNTIFGLYNYCFFVIKHLPELKNCECLFFFPYYHTGGAERVHLDILNAVKSKRCVVLFTMGSATTNFYNSFKNVAHVIELNSILNKKNKWITNILHRSIVNAINESKSLETIFGSNTTYYYKIISEVKPAVRKIDLFHAFEENDPKIGDILNSVKIINKRIVINQKAKNDIISFYKLNGVCTDYLKNIEIIQNGISLSENQTYFLKNEPIKIGFIGRWSVEKRPELFLEIAKKVKKQYSDIEFVMAGTGMRSNIDLINAAGVQFIGEITDKSEMTTLYNSLDFILVTSIYEGFPMVIMEAMSHGVIPIATNVGGISEHIRHENNGLLVDENEEETMVNLFCTHIFNLLNNQKEKSKLSNSAFKYSIKNFGIDSFNQSYQKLFFVK